MTSAKWRIDRTEASASGGTHRRPLVSIEKNFIQGFGVRTRYAPGFGRAFLWLCCSHGLSRQ